MSKLTKKIGGTLKGYWHHHKVWTLVIGFLVFAFIVSPVIDVVVDFIKDGTDPVAALKDQALMTGEVILGLIVLAVALMLLTSSFGGGGGGSSDGTALGSLTSRSTVHPQSDYRAQERAAQEARDAAKRGREALHALEQAGGDEQTMQNLRWEIKKADQDAETFQEWADD